MTRTVPSLFGLVLTCVGGLAQPDAAVLRIESVGHTVSNLEKTIPLYRDVLRLELLDQTATPIHDSGTQKLTNLPGVKFRTAHFKVPNTALTFELREFTGVDRTPKEANLGNPGTMWLTWSVNDEAAAVEALKKTDSRVISGRGYPNNPRIGSISTVFLRDPDGTVTEVVHRPPGDWFTIPPPAGAWQPGEQLVLALQFGTSIGGEQAMKFYQELLGFDIRLGYTRTLHQLFATPLEFPANGAWSDLGRGAGNVTGGATSGKSRMLTGNCATVRCEFMDQQTDPPREPLGARLQDPGAGSLSVWVRDVDSLLRKMKANGIEVLTAGGKPVLADGARKVIVRDPSGFYVELVQRANLECDIQWFFGGSCSSRFLHWASLLPHRLTLLRWCAWKGSAIRLPSSSTVPFLGNRSMTSRAVWRSDSLKSSQARDDMRQNSQKSSTLAILIIGCQGRSKDCRDA